jgi:hypothetical protein
MRLASTSLPQGFCCRRQDGNTLLIFSLGETRPAATERGTEGGVFVKGDEDRGRTTG